MKKLTLIKLILSLFVMIWTQQVQGQKKKLYFFADTTQTNKLNRAFEIGNEGPEIQFYLFYCKCIPPYQQHTLFVYRPLRNKPVYTDIITPYQFTPWSELSDLLSQKGQQFDVFYELYMVEPLPDRKFMINRVSLFIKKDVIVN